MACAVHDFQPVTNMRAVYRCTKCGGFAYKAKVRTGVGESGLVMYRCRHPGCGHPVVVIRPLVRARKIHKPSCALHRPDKPC